MTLHPFGDNFMEQREKYTLSGAIYCVKNGRKGERLCNNVGRKDAPSDEDGEVSLSEGEKEERVGN